MFNKMKRNFKKIMVNAKDTIKAIILALAVSYQTLPMQVYASGGSYISPLTNLKTVFVTIIAAAGVIVLGYGGVKFAISFQKMDQSGEHQAIFTVIAGGVMIGISALMTALGA